MTVGLRGESRDVIEARQPPTLVIPSGGRRSKAKAPTVEESHMAPIDHVIGRATDTEPQQRTQPLETRGTRAGRFLHSLRSVEMTKQRSLDRPNLIAPIQTFISCQKKPLRRTASVRTFAKANAPSPAPIDNAPPPC